MDSWSATAPREGWGYVHRSSHRGLGCHIPVSFRSPPALWERCPCPHFTKEEQGPETQAHANGGRGDRDPDVRARGCPWQGRGSLCP